jgi:DNA-binding transcriptional regulator YdaS (Cro superfamily)
MRPFSAYLPATAALAKSGSINNRVLSRELRTALDWATDPRGQRLRGAFVAAHS